IYTLRVYSPSGALLPSNITGNIDLSDPQNRTVIIAVQPNKYVAISTLDKMIISYVSGAEQTGRINSTSDNQLEVYYGDNITFSVIFENLSAPEGSQYRFISQAISNWSIFENDILVDTGELNYQNGLNFTFILNSSSYSLNTQYVIKISLSNSSVTTPPTITVSFLIKYWDTVINYSIENSGITYWRENITIYYDYITTLTEPDQLIDHPIINYEIADIGQIGNHMAIEYLANNSIKMEINLTNYGIGVYQLNVNFSKDYFMPMSLTINLRMIPAPTNASWSSQDEFLVTESGETFVRAALNETVKIMVNATTIPTKTFTAVEQLYGGEGFYTWTGSEEVGELSEELSGVYVTNITVANLTVTIKSGDVLDSSILITITKVNFTVLNIEIRLEILYKWPTNVEIISISDSVVPWGNNISILFNYYCTLAPRENRLLLDSNINFTDSINGIGWPSQYWYISKFANGTYILELNTSAYDIIQETIYLMDIGINQTFYYSKIITRAFGVKLLEVQSNISDSYDLIITSNMNLTLNFKIKNTESIWYQSNADGLTLTGAVKDSNGNIVYMLSFIESNGVYLSQITSTQITNNITADEVYTIEINGSKTNFRGFQLVASLTIKPIPLKIVYKTYTNSTITLEKGSEFNLVIELVDTFYNTTVNNATLTYTLIDSSGSTVATGSLINYGNGTYFLTIDFNEYPPDTYELTLNMIPLGNYKLSEEVSITRTIFLQQITEFPLLLIIGMIAGVAVAFPIGYKGYRYYQWARLPETVKRIINTIKTIKKEDVFDIVSPIHRDEILNKHVQTLFEKPELKDFSFIIGAELPLTSVIAAEDETLKENLRIRIKESLPDISKDELESLITELVSLPVEEREFMISSLTETAKEEVGGKVKTVEKVKETKEIGISISEELEKLLNEGIITEEEKIILESELSTLPPEEQRRFLDKLRER
ncbi:MAG: hypothetical protein ACTSYQ_01035, partial [Candidatus Odinarchaeia archaeon]